MSAGAVVMMLVAMAVIWGGLALAIIHLSRSSPTEGDVPPAGDVRRDL